MRKVLADSRIDLILLDLMLPGESGLALCRDIRASRTSRSSWSRPRARRSIASSDWNSAPTTICPSRSARASCRPHQRRAAAHAPGQRQDGSQQKPKRYEFDRWVLNVEARELVARRRRERAAQHRRVRPPDGDGGAAAARSVARDTARPGARSPAAPPSTAASTRRSAACARSSRSIRPSRGSSRPCGAAATCSRRR